MTRATSGPVTRKRHKRILKEAKGFWGQRGNIFRRANETVTRAQAFAYKGRKLKKRTMRGLFITRINAAVKSYNVSYSSFMHGLAEAQIHLNRKMLSQLAIFDLPVFEKIVQLASVEGSSLIQQNSMVNS